MKGLEDSEGQSWGISPDDLKGHKWGTSSDELKGHDWGLSLEEVDEKIGELSDSDLALRESIIMNGYEETVNPELCDEEESWECWD